MSATARTLIVLTSVLALGLPGAAGCMFGSRESIVDDRDWPLLEATAMDIEYPDVAEPVSTDIGQTPPPITLRQDQPPQPRDMSLQEAVQLALANSPVFRDLGGLVLQFPAATRSVYDPAIVDTDPRFGIDAALSAFDASLGASAFFEKNDRALNNFFQGANLQTRMYQQDLGSYNFELAKRTAQGTDLAFRSIFDYDQNTAPGNNIPSLLWTAIFEAEFRQPLLQGAGVDFNRIAGPSGTPGVYNGVLIARVNEDVSLAEFETGVRDLVSIVENAYWELYYAYRDLDAKLKARQRALDTWRGINTLRIAGQTGGEAENEAQAREQFFRLEAEVQNALSGRVLEKTRSDVFRGTGGVYVAERRLRLAIGLPASDGQLIRPSDEPNFAPVIFDWDEILAESLARRVELRRQRWQIKRRELELFAARNFLWPRMDAVGRYRFRGLGRDLVQMGREGRSQFDNAFMNLTSGDYQEWALGIEITMPVGFRQAHAAVRNAELLVTRDTAVLKEQEREIVNDLSNAVAEAARAYGVAQTNFNRRVAAQQQLDALQTVYEKVAEEKDKGRLLNLLLDAQRRLAEAESLYYQSLIEYTLAIKDVHLEKGSLLDYNEIYLSEGPWPEKAYYDAGRRERVRRPAPRLDSLVRSNPPAVSQGPFPQVLAPAIPNDPFVPPEPVPAERLPPPQPAAPGVHPDPSEATGMPSYR